MEETKKFHERIATKGYTLVLPQELREKSLEILNETAFPTTKTEAWKYTRTTRISNGTFQLANPTIQSVTPYLIEGLNGNILVFVNGFYQANLSTIIDTKGLHVSSLACTPHDWVKANTKVSLEGEVFNALNTAFTTDGVCIEIAKNAIIEEPIQLIYITTGSAVLSSVRNILIANDNSEATVTMNYVGENAEANFTNVITEVTVKTNASLSIHKVQHENNTNFHINTETVSQGRDSRFTLSTSTFSGAIVRNNVYVHVDGENAETNLYGLYLTDDKQLVDNHTVIDHKVPNCNSNELYKGVLDGQSTGVFNGKVYVREQAQKINAFQSNGNVLLSDNASMNSKPELEIYADDVKCSHGSTTGQIDEEAIFYLRARGISEKSAKSLMINGFVGEVVDQISNEIVREQITKLMAQKLGYSFE
ncbi:MAG: Fe-S cluster assembly protein SufD [Crocinitomicaceae bacterium]|jgi:Fe-S cluster assembly protein SufD